MIRRARFGVPLRPKHPAGHVTGRLVVEPFSIDDAEHVRELANRDCLPPQPECRSVDVADAVYGRASVDAGYWRSFSQIETVVCRAAGGIAGAASYALGPDRSFLLWLHAGEVPAVVDTLLAVFEARACTSRVMYAFCIATPLTVGVEGLPVTYRRTTHRLLLSRGFRATDAWLYMHARTSARRFVSRVGVRPTIAPDPEFGGWTLGLHNDCKRLGVAQVSLERGLGVFWFLMVEKPMRGQGIGRILFQHGNDLLRRLGARDVILYVDHDDPGARNRRPGIALYRSEGFHEVDHLFSYVKRAASR